MEHFGVKVIKKKYELKLVRNEYAIINNKSSIYKGKIYSDEWCKTQYKKAMENYDLNMEYFSLLDKKEFNEEINSFLNIYKEFKEVKDLKLFNGKSGYYIMILDEYKQLYIGTTNDIKRRIQQHWSKRVPFDRLIFGTVDNSIMSINSFNALDTTRIYAYPTDGTYINENEYIDYFSPCFVCNRLEGGKIEYGLLQAINMMKSRKLKESKKVN